MERIQGLMDKSAICLSFACVIHCLLVPFALVVPALASLPIMGEEFHLMLLAAVLPVSIIALSLGFKKHKQWRVITHSIIGFVILLLAATIGHDILGETGEKIATIIGALFVSYSHVNNYKLCCVKKTCQTSTS
ncbi:MerC domain-containing protein [Thalassotalea euphylliae]|uniref:MerC domain-containing protein n=1 Tax=Thalassotalea euphylliae TaxID=1655234 RepID=UPI0036451F8C